MNTVKTCGLLFLAVVLVRQVPAQTQFADLTSQQFGSYANSVAFGDVDRDGDLDVIVATLCGNADRLHLNNGRGVFTDVTGSHMPAGMTCHTSVALGDVDRDGDLDLVFGCGKQNRLCLNDGSGKFTDVTASHMPVFLAYTSDVALGDVDGDGDLDLVTGNKKDSGSVGDSNRLYLNDGKGKFTLAPAGQLPSDTDLTTEVALADVDGDRDLDVICGNGGQYFKQQSRLYLNNGQGKFTDATASRLPTLSDYTSGVTVGDVDRDGDPDLVFLHLSSQNRLYLNDGKGTFTDVTATHLPQDSDPSTSAVLADVDGDQDLDLAIANYFNAQDRLYLNDGKGRFSDATAKRVPAYQGQSGDMACGDVDADGDLDLLYVSQGVDRLLLNLHRHVHAPVPIYIGWPYQLDYYARPGYAFSAQYAFPFVNLVPAVPPIRIPPFGSLGLSPVGIAPLPMESIPIPRGMVSYKLVFPNAPALVGQKLYVQALIVHSLSPYQAHMTNVVADPILK